MIRKLDERSISLKESKSIGKPDKIVIGRVDSVEESNEKILKFVVLNQKDDEQRVVCIARGSDAHRLRYLIKENEMIRIKKTIMTENIFKLGKPPASRRRSEQRDETNELPNDVPEETDEILSIDFRTDIRLLPRVKSKSGLRDEVLTGSVESPIIFGKVPSPKWGSLGQLKP